MTRETQTSEPRNELRLYHRLSGLRRLGYRGKILLVAFLGAQVPLIAAALYLVLAHDFAWRALAGTLAVAVLATLAGTAITFVALSQLLRPVSLTARALRHYREARVRTPLPTGYADEVGTLMADADRTMEHLDGVRDRLEYQDEATGLPNRKRFLQLVAARVEQGAPFAVVVVRFNNLGRIADTLDRHHADQAMRIVGGRLALRAHIGEHLARVGAHQFGGFLVGSGDGEACGVEAATRVQAAIDACVAELDLEGVVIAPVLRAGITVFPDDGLEPVVLLDQAIAASALPESTPVTLHSPQARAAAVSRLRIEQELRRAIDHNEFELAFQPVVDVAATRAVGAEALIRWRHPERGLVPPLEFIGAAEASGLIQPIGLWVLRRACAQLREWNDGGRRDLKMAINLSARQFLDPHLRSHVQQAIDNHGISPDQLEIELTETSAMVDHAHTHRVFTALRDMGVGIAIDDFGTGYASLSYLRKLPFDKLKIDREFVTDVHRTHGSQAICGALIELSRGLDLKVLAEGAETAQEVRWLAERGCNLFQGYYFSRPVPGKEFLRVIDTPGRFGMPAASAPAPGPAVSPTPAGNARPAADARETVASA